MQIKYLVETDILDRLDSVTYVVSCIVDDMKIYEQEFEDFRSAMLHASNQAHETYANRVLLLEDEERAAKINISVEISTSSLYDIINVIIN